MNELRCKPGDLAVVISAKYRRNLGIIVRVISMDNRTGALRYPWETPVWLAESEKLMVWVSDGKRHSSKRGPIPDAQLQPIRGDRSDQGAMDESVFQKPCGTFLIRQGLQKTNPEKQQESSIYLCEAVS